MPSITAEEAREKQACGRLDISLGVLTQSENGREVTMSSVQPAEIGLVEIVSSARPMATEAPRGAVLSGGPRGQGSPHPSNWGTDDGKEVVADDGTSR